MINEGVQFVLRLKDYMSGALPKVGSAAQSAFAKVDTGSAKAQKSVDLTNRSVKTLERAMRMLEKRRDLTVGTKGIEQANQKIQILSARVKELKGLGKNIPINPTVGGSTGSSRGMMGMGYGKVAGLVAMLGLGAAATGATAYSARAGLQAGAQKVSFQTMGGEAAGAKLYTDLTKFAQESIYGNEVYKLAQTQMAFGADAKQVMPTVSMLGDVSMGDKQRLESLNLAYSQARSAGKLMGQDLLQFVNAGFNPLQEISAATGRSMAQLREDMSKGKISFDDVDAAFVRATSSGGKFYKMTERIAETPFGKVEAMRGQVQGLGLQLGEAMAPAIGQLVDKYGKPAVDFLGRELIPKVSGLVNGAMNTIDEFAPLVKGILSSGGQIVKAVGGFVTSDEFKSIASNTLQLIDGIGKDIKDPIKELIEVLKPIAGTLGGVLSWANTGFATRQQRRELIANTRFYNSPEGRVSAYDKMMAVNKSLNLTASNGVTPTPAQLAQMIQVPGKAQSVFGAQFTRNATTPAATPTPTGNTTKNFMDELGAGGGAGSTDAITGGGRKVVNINVNASPFNIEKMEVGARGGGLTGMNEMEQRFNEWFLRLLNSANAAG